MRSLHGRLTCALSLFGLLAISKLCSAQSAPRSATPASEADDAPSRAPTRRWYGWQTLSADGVAAAFFVGAVATDHNAALFGCSALTFLAAGPVVHGAHGQWGAAVGSAGLRIAAPFLGAVIGNQYDAHQDTGFDDSNGRSNNSSTKWTTTGLAIGALAASAFDGLLWAYEPPPAPKAALSPTPSPRIDALPTLLVTGHGASLQVSGTL